MSEAGLSGVVWSREASVNDNMLRSETHGIHLSAEVRKGWVLLSISPAPGWQRMTVRLCPSDAMAMGSRLIELACLGGAASDIAGH